MNHALELAPVDGPVGAGERKWKAVYTIIERGGARKVWCRIGTAFVNRDGSLNVKLDAVPVNGTLHIRDPEPASDAREARDEPAPRRSDHPYHAHAGGLP